MTDQIETSSSKKEAINKQIVENINTNTYPDFAHNVDS